MSKTPEQIEAFHAGALSFMLSVRDSAVNAPFPAGVTMDHEHLVMFLDGMVGNVIQAAMDHGLDPKERNRILERNRR